MYVSSVDPYEATMKRGGYSEAFIKQARENGRRRKQEENKANLERQARRIMKENSAPDWVIDILIEVSDRHEVSALDIAGRSLERKIVRARHETVYLVKAAKPMLSTPKIASWFGRDHTSILFAIASHSEKSGLPSLTTYDLAKTRRRNAVRQAYWRRQEATA